MDFADFGPSGLLLLFVVLPLWIVAGTADWLCHRASRIEVTAGPPESLMHLLLLAEAGIALLAGLLLEINGLVLLIMLVCFVAHEATSYWDIRYAAAHRVIRPIEQKVHDYMIALPVAALFLVAVSHWDATLSLVGLAPFDAGLHLKQPPLPVGYVIGILVAVALLNGLPFLEELWRGLRANRRSAVASDGEREFRQRGSFPAAR